MIFLNEILAEGPSENVNPAEDMPLSNFDPLSPISASNPAPQIPAVTAPAVTPAEPVPEAVSEDSPAPLTSGNSDILSLLQGKSPEQIAQLLVLAQGTSASAAPAEESPALETQPLELPAVPETAPVVSETPVEAPTILEEPIAENPAPIEDGVSHQEEQQQSTGLGIQIAQPGEETPVAEAPAEAALPEVSTELFPEGDEEGEEVLNFEGII